MWRLNAVYIYIYYIICNCLYKFVWSAILPTFLARTNMQHMLLIKSQSPLIMDSISKC